MRPEQLNEWVTLYEGDCMDVLPTLGKVDCVITDPPYSETTHAGARSCSGSATLKRTGKKANASVTFASVDVDYVRNCFSMCEISRWLVTFLDWRHALPMETEPPEGMEFVRLGVWTKPNPMPQLTKDRPGTAWESIAILHNIDSAKRWNGGSASAVWNYGTSRWGYFGPSNHPTEKPLPLIKELVDLFTDPGETILDPFAGSGTTGIAAMLMGRKCILIEKDAKYCEVIRKRVREADATSPGKLFAPSNDTSLFSEASL